MSKKVCGMFSLVVIEEDSVKVAPIGCGLWKCPLCAKRKANHWIARIRNEDAQLFITLTLNPATIPPEVTPQKQIYRAFSKLVKRIRDKRGPFEYVATLEFTKRGLPHLHVIARSRYIPQKWLSQQAQQSGLGKICYIKKVDSAGRAVRYIAKYLLKAADATEFEAGTRRIRASRGFFQNSVKHPKHEPRAGGSARTYFSMLTYEQLINQLVIRKIDMLPSPDPQDGFYAALNHPAAHAPPFYDPEQVVYNPWDRIEIDEIANDIRNNLQRIQRNAQNEHKRP
jgi:hypothetical protein